MELTILMPCLNESETLETCIKKALRFLHENNVDGEVLIADNGSDDGSIEIAMKYSEEGVRVINVIDKGYGNALRAGCIAANGRYVIMGDADDSYDFLHLMPFMEKLRDGNELVMGNRFMGGIEKGAMPWSHRYIGNPVLSFIGRLFYGSKIGDFHCGLRGYNRESMLKLNLKTSGMEYASEMVIMAEMSNLRIAEVPTNLKRDGRTGKPHLRSFRDGWRHLKFLFMYAPKWLFLYPSFFLFLIGLIGSLILIGGQLHIFKVTFSIHTLLYCMFFVVAGWNIMHMFFMMKLYVYNSDFLLNDGLDWNKKIKEDIFIFTGSILILIGIALSVCALAIWKNAGYSTLTPEYIMRIVIPAVSLMIMGIESLFSGFLMGIFKMK